MEAFLASPVHHRSRLPATATRLRRCSDDQLVERFRAGREEAFQVIHDRYRARLLAYVRQMLDGRAGVEAEDVLQDVFERAARTLRADRTPVGLRAWLYSVAHNRCVDELRRRPPASPDVIAASRPPAGDTSAVAERRAEVERLFRDLRALPELQRSALLMRELQGLSHAELAQALDASVPAVKSLLVRARIGLVDAEEARGVPCATIRDDLASSYDRRVKASAQAARHLRECPACRTYRAELRRTSRRLASLLPGPTFLPLAAVGRLLGGAGLHAEAPAAMSGVAGSGGAAIAGVGKLVAVLGTATVLTTGAVLEGTGTLPWSAPQSASRAPAAARVIAARHGAPGTQAGPIRPARGRQHAPASSPPPGSGVAAGPAGPAGGAAGSGSASSAPATGAPAPAATGTAPTASAGPGTTSLAPAATAPATAAAGGSAPAALANDNDAAPASPAPAGATQTADAVSTAVAPAAQALGAAAGTVKSVADGVGAPVASTTSGPAPAPLDHVAGKLAGLLGGSAGP